MTFTVRIRENSHDMDESEAYGHGTFATYAEGETACRNIVDDYLAGARRPGISAEDLFRSYTMFGEDPAVDAPPGPAESVSRLGTTRGRSAGRCAKPDFSTHL